MNEQNGNTDVTLDDLQNSYIQQYGEPTFADSSNGGAGEQGERQSGENQGENPQSAQGEQAADVGQGAANTGGAVTENNGGASADAGEIYGNYAHSAGILEENNALKQQIEQLKQQLSQSEKANESIANGANQNFAEQITALEKPVFDGDAYSYASDDDRVHMMNDYSEKLIEYGVNKAKDDIMAQIAPLLSQYRKQTEDAEFSDAISKLGELEGMGDISDYADAIKKISARDEFKGMNPYMRATNAALIARGLKSMNKQPTDINARVEEIYSDPELMKALETRRLRQIENGRTKIPPAAASNGLSSTAYQPQARPQRLEDLM